MLSYRSYVPATILLVGCAFVWNARSQASMKLAAPLNGILPEVPGYERSDVTIKPEERRVAGMSDYVLRVFRKDSTSGFTTFVSYYDRQTQGKTIHSPRNCLPGAGWEVLSAGTADVAVDGHTYTLNRYLLKNKGESAIVYYWYQGRGRVVANEYVVKWNLLRDAALAGHTEEALVRVVVPVISLPSADSAAGSSSAAKAIDTAAALGLQISAQLTREVAQALPKA